MDEIIKYLKEKKVDETLGHALSVAPKVFGEDFDKDVLEAAMKDTLMHIIGRDDELQDMVFKYAIDVVLRDIIAGLDIKIDESAKMDKSDKAAALIAMLMNL